MEKISFLFLLVTIVKGQEDSGATTTSSPGAASTTTFPNVITFARTTKWKYVTLQPPGDDYLDDLNPWRTKRTTTTTTTPMPTGTTFPPALDIFQSDFDQGLGGFRNDVGSFNWTRWTMKNPHVYTGPEFDHTTGSGYYMYIDCSEPKVSGMVARLVTPDLETSTGCTNIMFWLHAYGYHLGRFTVLVSETPYKKWTKVFEHKKPSQDTEWNFINVTGPGLNYRVRFEGVVGSGYQGNYAIDDVLIKSIACSQKEKNLTAFAGEPLHVGETEQSGIQKWAIVLIALSIVAFVVAVLLLGYLVYRQKKTREQRDQEDREEEELRKQELESDGVIRTDRPYSTRLRSAQQRPAGRILPSAQRRMAPGYGARLGSTASNTYGRLDIPTSAVSKRGYSPKSALATRQGDSGYDQDTMPSESMFATSNSSRAPSARPRTRLAELTTPLPRMPSIFGEDTPPSSGNARNRQPVQIEVEQHSNGIQNPATMRPESPDDL